MVGILQSGSVTPGHLVQWTTDGVVQDGGVSPFNVIASLRSANFNITSDQPIVIPATIVAFRLSNIIITNSAVSLTTAQGGFYPAASKGGTPIVAASQSYSALTSINALMLATLAAYGSGTRFSGANLGSIAGQLAIWLSLTTPQGINALADVYLIGDNLT